MYSLNQQFDVVVIGGGHAGIEAGLAAARLGCSVGVFTIQLDAVGNMPCNPSIGGTAKGHLVREIDALGGEMGKAADATMLQSRMLNLGKGPAVHSLRVQSDRIAYRQYMKQALERQENLRLIQGEIVRIDIADGRVCGVETRLGAYYPAKTVILATGTYLGGRIIVGECVYEGGPDGMFAANILGEQLLQLGLPLRRFKTGTPPRVNRRSIDFSRLEEQPGDEVIIPFSFETDEATLQNQVVCHMTYTNPRTHKIIMDNLHRSPLYSGLIEGVGPRYCPSIETKVERFRDKERHQIFIEPCGIDTEEMYIQGLSSSMPEDVQLEFLHTMVGMEKAEVMRVGYAIEYDCVDPTALKPTLECKAVAGLYGAGQFNGSSGYEEAAAQGLVAGINAAHQVLGREPFVPLRSSSYIGTLIDDLVTKGTEEPYRMMTSRSEYRLILRQDNADLRLTPTGYALGLISEERYQKFFAKKANIEQEIHRLRHTVISPKNQALQGLLAELGMSPITTGARMSDLLCRPGLSYANLAAVDTERPVLTRAEAEQAEVTLKYEGYIEKQYAQVRQAQKLEGKLLPEDMDYEGLQGLRLEARQKLSEIRPRNIGQAARISGVSPADVSVLLIYLEQKGREKNV